MNKFLVSLILILNVSCSSVEFSSRSVESFYLAAKPGSDVIYTKEISKDFYFWGLSPEKSVVLLEDEFQDMGLSHPSFVIVEQGHSAKDIFMMLITLGLYAPSTYKVTLLSNGNMK